MKITAYCLEWHINQSGAFRYVLVDALRNFADIQLQPWNGRTLPRQKATTAPQVFCQLPPPPELLSDPQANLVWLPMWDHAKGYSKAWWAALPKSLRIVAFSEVVANQARSAGLTTMHIQYFQDPAQFQPVNWDQGRVLMYWNRRGIVAPSFLKKLCRELKIDKLFFRPQIDPEVHPQAAYRLPARMGQTVIEEVPESLERDEYLQLLKQANIFLAPRLDEGIGMTFVEALAQGCAVFGFDAPTMNEYITSGENGFLFQCYHPSIRNRLLLKMNKTARRYFLWHKRSRKKHFEYPVSLYQDWQTIASLNLEKMGHCAHQHHWSGFKNWRETIPMYARYVLEW